jgi:hypothetical protein
MLISVNIELKKQLFGKQKLTHADPFVGVV